MIEGEVENLATDMEVRPSVMNIQAGIEAMRHDGRFPPPRRGGPRSA